MKVNSSRNGKPEIAVLAGKIADEIDQFFELADSLEDDMSDYLIEDELNVLKDAASILSFFEREYTVDHRGY